MRLEHIYDGGRLTRIEVHRPPNLTVMDCRGKGVCSFVSVTAFDDTTEVHLYLSDSVVDLLRDALCQLPALEPTPDNETT